MTDAREQRALEIAAVCKLTKRADGTWVVPSQSGSGRYIVQPNRHCSCPDHELRLCRCKHLIAVGIVMKREQNADGSTTVTESVTVRAEKRTTYAQNWPAYNEAQTNEKREFQILLHDLCRNLPNPPQGKGRPRLALADAVFSVAFKIYSTVSGRRFISDLCDAQDKGFISSVPHFNSIFNYLENPEMTPILTDLITTSSLPLTSIETDFAVDATGFGSSRFVKWFNFKYGEERTAKDWIKLHLMCGVKTNIVTSVKITEKYEHDTKFLPALVSKTADNFQLAQVSADKGYHSRNNYSAIIEAGAAPFIPFKSTSKTEYDNKQRRVDPTTMWNKMYHLYHFRRDEFLPHYHKRSNVESTFMAIKTKFGDGVRSRTPVSQTNEVLCKVLCHNICVVIQSMYELGIDPMFERIGGDAALA